MKIEFLFGVHPIHEAIKANRRKFFEIFITKDSPRLKKILACAESLNIPIKKISPDKLKSLCKSEFHQNIGARVSPYPLADISCFTKKTSPFLLILDSVLDTHNLGAIIRTALCVGVDGVILPKDRAAHPTPAVSKASAGALEHIQMAQVTNLSRFLQEFKEKGIWISGLDMGGKQTIFKSNLTGPLALVIGGEEKGIRPLVKKQCDFLVSIPQEGPLNSLNASVAGAVVMYEAYRQRQA